MSEITTTFKDGYTIKHYYFAYSCTFVCLGLLSYIQTLKDSELKTKLIEFLQVRAIYMPLVVYIFNLTQSISESFSNP